MIDDLCSYARCPEKHRRWLEEDCSEAGIIERWNSLPEWVKNPKPRRAAQECERENASK